jgi:hypothetical protein
MVCCTSCGKAFGDEGPNRNVASISGSFMGDEYTEYYHYCEQCGVYTVEIYHDRFLGESSVILKGPVPKSEGDEKVRLIGECLEPWDKKCRCKAHMKYFDGCLD